MYFTISERRAFFFFLFLRIVLAMGSAIFKKTKQKQKFFPVCLTIKIKGFPCLVQININIYINISKKE